MALLCGVLVLLCAAFAASQDLAPIPALKARVTDLTGTLSAEQIADLERRLADFEARKGSQIAVLVVPTTAPEAIDQYSIRVAEAWKVGRKGTDDGVILVVAKNDRKLRLEVGYGLEGAVPDAYAKRIIREVIAPRFQQGDFYGGITAGTQQLMRLIEGEKLPAPAPREEPQGDFGGSAGMLVRRDVWDSLGGFDTAMPLFREDVDFCWRVHQAGHRVRVITDAVVYHVEASARRRRSASAARPSRPAHAKSSAAATLWQ